MAPSQSRNWWKDGTCYQIWPASYRDSDGDGVGDIPGIISTLDYIKDLGIDTIWLSPMYDSPQVDMGYDISNYEDVYPAYGTLQDMEELISETHKRGMKLILDLVVNHTSDQHAWFKESKADTVSDKADWYIWKKPKMIDGVRHPPNNWRAIFGGSAWEYVEARDEYYLHLFCVEQPDLNWENPVTRQAIYKSAIEFWLSRGVDGFRVDTVNLYSKDTSYPDAPVVQPEWKYQSATELYVNGPRMHEFLQEMRAMALDKYGDVMMVGELPDTKSKDDVLAYVKAEARELSMVFDFDICRLGGWAVVEKHEFYWHKLSDLKNALMKTQSLLEDQAWTTVFGENHDQARSISRLTTDDPKYHYKAGQLLATLWATLSGTLFIYQGQEIGMVNVPAEWKIDSYQDIDALNYWKEMNERYPGNEEMLGKAMYGLHRLGRDNARTPVQWDDSANAGFTTGKPWMRVHDNYKEINVAKQQSDPKSIHAYWKRCLAIRKEHAEVMIHGSFEVVDFADEKVFRFWKTAVDGGKAYVVCNFSADEQEVEIPEGLRLLLCNADEAGEKLGPWEGRIYVSA